MNRRTFAKIAPAVALTALCGQSRRVLVVFEGNSLTALNASWIPITWTTLFLQSATAKRLNLAGVNVAVGGDGIVQCAARAPTYVDPLRALCDVGCVVLWEGTNGLGQNAYDADKTFEQHMQYVRDRKVTGWRVVVGTIASRRYGSPPIETPEHENARLRFNQLIRANWREFSGIIDIGADDKLGQQYSAWDAAYFRDGIHLTQAGAQRVADIATPVIVSALNYQQFLPAINKL